jgi:ribosomal protein L2
MAIKIYKPTSPGRRASSVNAFADVTKHKPEKSLITILQPKSGRNNQGHITVRHQGGGAKKFYRLVDFKQQRFGVEATVLAIEYDPNRTSRIALVEYSDKVKNYLKTGGDLYLCLGSISPLEKIRKHAQKNGWIGSIDPIAYRFWGSLILLEPS